MFQYKPKRITHKIETFWKLVELLKLTSPIHWVRLINMQNKKKNADS